jgi:C1A family cysteine protease/PKD repeat protein
MAPVNPAFLDHPSSSLGYVPPPVDLSYLRKADGPGGGEARPLGPGLPAWYDLRAVGNKLTAVRDQGIWGTCWTFATYGSLESCLLPAETNNFSEKNLANLSGFDLGPVAGGNAFMSSAYLARWNGPVWEADDPYPSNLGWLGSPALPAVRHVQQIRIVPDRDFTGIKEAVTNHGAVYTTMWWDNQFYTGATDFAYRAAWTSGEPHAVAIVGWDDGFSAARFNHVPPGDGAFIARNSWGPGWGEGGYFYCSYYDVGIGFENFAFMNGETNRNFERVYEYDRLGWVGSLGYSNTTAWAANVFTNLQSSSRSLEAAGLYAVSTNVTCELYVYTGGSGNNPRSGTLCSAQTNALTAPGYHTLALRTPVPVASTQRFSIVTRQIAAGCLYPIACEYPLPNYSSLATAGPGQSYISANGSGWQDLTVWRTNANACLKGYMTLPPPTNVAASDGAYADRVRVTWAAVSGATSYEVWRGTNGQLTGAARIGDSATTNFDNQALDPGGTYVYWIRAANADCVSRFSTNNPGYAQAALAVAPTNLVADCIPGENATNQAFEVRNAGGTTLVYAVATDAPWLSCWPTNGTCVSERDTIAVQYASAGLTAGTYRATIAVTAAPPAAAFWTVTVTLSVAAPRVLAVDPTNLTAGCVLGEDATNQTFAVWNAGGGTLGYAIAGGSAWVSCWPTNGSSTGEHDPIAVSCATAGLATGVYAAAFTVSVVAPDTGTPRTVSVTLTVRRCSEHYVSISNRAPVAPYASWAKAATNIQDAVDAALDGDAVVVSNGVYAAGGRTVFGAMTNRLAVDRAVTVRSVNGPAVTTILGRGPPGPAAVRCVYLTNGAALVGFTLSNGCTLATGGTGPDRERSGGGAWCESAAALLSNCVLAGNSACNNGGGTCGGTLRACTVSGNAATNNGGGGHDAVFSNCVLRANAASQGGGANASSLYNCLLSANVADGGGGAALGTLRNCAAFGNLAAWGGGASGAALDNCTLSGNAATEAGGGASGCTLRNCILWANTGFAPNHYSCTLSFSCTIPCPGGTNNIADDPRLATAWRLGAGSPCIGQGTTAAASGADLDGEPWHSPPSMGCDEPHGEDATGSLRVAIAASCLNCAAGFAVDFTAQIDGPAASSVWSFGDGAFATNRAYTRHAWAAPGTYDVTLTAYNAACPAGVAATAKVTVVAQPVHYVWPASPGPASPYGTWGTAAHGIQEAVDAATVRGALVLVTNGLYDSGGRPVYGIYMTNRLVVGQAITVQSVNGPAVTVIEGHKPGHADRGIRCVYLAGGAVLAGFTLTNGFTMVVGDAVREQSGGGVWCEAWDAVVSNCVLAGNGAEWSGGGAYRGTFFDCDFIANAGDLGAEGGGAIRSTLHRCLLAGNIPAGAALSELHGCVVSGNRTDWSNGGGADRCTLYNCTVASNAASGSGGGAFASTLYNSIVWDNVASDGSNTADCVAEYCCTLPVVTGAGNVAGPPLFVDAAGGNFRLRADSPCRDAGCNRYVTGGMDRDGGPRIRRGQVDMGAYERPGACTVLLVR